MALSPNSVLESLSWRYATKVFDPARSITPEVWKALEQSLTLTPSSYGLQPYRFLVVENPDVRAKLRPLSWGQAQITDASHLLIFLAKNDLDAADVDHYLARIAEVRGGSVEDMAAFRGLMVGNLVEGPRHDTIQEWAARQAYIAFGQVMLSAALLGIDACPLEGLDPKGYDEVLGVADSGYRTVAACAFGYRVEDDKYASLLKVRFPEEELILRR